MVAMEFETLGKITENLEDVSKPIKAVEVSLFCLSGIQCIIGFTKFSDIFYSLRRNKSLTQQETQRKIHQAITFI